jgi:hypothetical protein
MHKSPGIYVREFLVGGEPMVSDETITHELASQLCSTGRKISSEDLFALIYAACEYSNLPLIQRLVELSGLRINSISAQYANILFAECVVSAGHLPTAKWVHDFCKISRAGMDVSLIMAHVGGSGDVELIQWIVESFDIEWHEFAGVLADMEWPCVLWLMRKFRMRVCDVALLVSPSIRLALQDVGDLWDF